MPSRERINTEAFFASMQRDYEGDPDVRLELKVDQTGLYGDYDLLRQAVSNLISNAVKYSPKPAYIAITVARSAITGGVEIAIADQGRGIPADELERVFEPTTGLAMRLVFVASAWGPPRQALRRSAWWPGSYREPIGFRDACQPAFPI